MHEWEDPPNQPYVPLTEREIQKILSNREKYPRKELSASERNAAMLAGELVLGIARAVIRKDQALKRRIMYGDMQRYDLSGIVSASPDNAPSIREVTWGGKLPFSMTEIFRFYSDHIDQEFEFSTDKRLDYTVEADFSSLTQLANDIHRSVPLTGEDELTA